MGAAITVRELAADLPAGDGAIATEGRTQAAMQESTRRRVVPLAKATEGRESEDPHKIAHNGRLGAPS
jgi:hypothetical protein